MKSLKISLCVGVLGGEGQSLCKLFRRINPALNSINQMFNFPGDYSILKLVKRKLTPEKLLFKNWKLLKGKFKNEKVVENTSGQT